jgi:hypothetical protein
MMMKEPSEDLLMMDFSNRSEVSKYVVAEGDTGNLHAV